jgi:hypothetical protein
LKKKRRTLRGFFDDNDKDDGNGLPSPLTPRTRMGEGEDRAHPEVGGEGKRGKRGKSVGVKNMVQLRIRAKTTTTTATHP